MDKKRYLTVISESNEMSDKCRLFLGLRIVLSGFSGFEDDKWFVLHINPQPSTTKDRSVSFNSIKIDNLLKMLMKDIPNIKIKED